MSRTILLDAGPLVAYFDRQDQDHEWAVDQWEQLNAPFVTCESVISEACYLLRRVRKSPSQAVSFVGGAIWVNPILAEHSSEIAELMAKYADVPMSLADACLVKLSEKYPEGAVLTLDSDFRRYRRFTRQSIPTIMPPQK